jgi:hypothetical protein
MTTENPTPEPKAADKPVSETSSRPARQPSVSPADREKMMQDAMERERNAGRSTDDLGDDAADPEDQHLWVHSNRTDDRVVLMEIHPAHPGGQAFVGGPGVAKVGRSPEIERLLYTGELIEVPEPPKTVKNDNGDSIPNPRYPVVGTGSGQPPVTQQPGQPILLGRQVDPEIWGENGKQVAQDVRRRQRSMPGAINPAPGGITPPGMPGTVAQRERDSRR